MAAVIDANLLVALATRDPRRPLVAKQFRAWESAGEALHGPDLITYELANAMAGLLAAGQIAEDDIDETWRTMSAVPITLHRLIQGPAVVRVANLLRRRSAYDAAYIALAQALDAELWTLDGPLARNARGAGLPVRLVDAP